MTTLRIRYFAGAAHAAGSHEDLVAVEDGETLRGLTDRLGSENVHLAQVLAVSSFLIDGVVTTDGAVAVSAAQTIDVLPPFAGG